MAWLLDVLIFIFGVFMGWQWKTKRVMKDKTAMNKFKEVIIKHPELVKESDSDPVFPELPTTEVIK